MFLNGSQKRDKIPQDTDYTSFNVKVHGTLHSSIFIFYANHQLIQIMTTKHIHFYGIQDLGQSYVEFGHVIIQFKLQVYTINKRIKK